MSVKGRSRCVVCLGAFRVPWDGFYAVTSTLYRQKDLCTRCWGDMFEERKETFISTDKWTDKWVKDEWTDKWIEENSRSKRLTMERAINRLKYGEL